MLRPHGNSLDFSAGSSIIKDAYNVATAWGEPGRHKDAQMIIRPFVELIKPYKFLVLGATITLTLSTNLELVVPWMLKILIDRVLPNHAMNLLWAIVATLVVVYIFKTMFSYMSNYLMSYTGQRVLLDLRIKIFRHLQSMSLGFFQKYRSGKLISNVFNDVDAIGGLVATVSTLTDNIARLGFILILLCLLNMKLGLIFLPFVLLHFIMFIVSKRILQRDSLVLREKLSEVCANFSENIIGVKVVKAFSKERQELSGFMSDLRPMLDMSVNLNVKSVKFGLLTSWINLASTLVVIVVGTYQISAGKATVGDFVAFYTYIGMALIPIVYMSQLALVISNGFAATERIMKLLSVVPEIKEAPNAIKIGRLNGEVEFRDVCFGYEPDKLVLDGFSLQIHTGEKVALVGPSGSGKSTVTNLLLRFYDVAAGAVLLDGKDVRKLKLDSFRKQFGVVLQEPYLFSGTIAENIAYAKPEATFEQIREAARQANAEEFIDKLDDGYRARLGENGATLSGGQKQRIAIARAVLNDPAILILDEATSALDTVSEVLVQEALDRLMKNRTSIIIAHRLSTVKNADKLVVLDKGKIAQVGTHDELVGIPGLYQDMFKAQEKANKEAAAKHPF